MGWGCTSLGSALPVLAVEVADNTRASVNKTPQAVETRYPPCVQVINELAYRSSAGPVPICDVEEPEFRYWSTALLEDVQDAVSNALGQAAKDVEVLRMPDSLNVKLHPFSSFEIERDCGNMLVTLRKSDGSSVMTEELFYRFDPVSREWLQVSDDVSMTPALDKPKLTEYLTHGMLKKSDAAASSQAAISGKSAASGNIDMKASSREKEKGQAATQVATGTSERQKEEKFDPLSMHTTGP